ncbi:hypothetical protein C2846_18345 [Pseudomonas jilinensis]|uniref:Uncharacterized protein n=1 Tax=Pseudomonas jilinensis TaxID=2078689 RepID=A0A396RSK4_9PSED|nr:hypothetical protein C2846_18345 [Pseudomonas jilinensis]
MLMITAVMKIYLFHRLGFVSSLSFQLISAFVLLLPIAQAFRLWTHIGIRHNRLSIAPGQALPCQTLESRARPGRPLALQISG